VRDGLNRDAFANRFGVSLEEVFGDVIPELVDVGLLRSDNDALRLSEKGYLISNQVFIRLMESGTQFAASLMAHKPFQ
jgi:oxygen-independent coproporphyrinogen-3 oxidase